VIDSVVIDWPSGTHQVLNPVVPIDVILDVTEGEAITGIHQADIPTAFMLHAATPNPFNPMTEIRYDLPRDVDVTLRIYDLSGRLVRTLVASEATNAGRHTAIWYGRDDDGRGLPSGVYVYRLEASEFVQTKKMALVR
jgi:hypothetical protein